MQSLVDGGVVKLIGICILCSMVNCDSSKVGMFPSIDTHAPCCTRTVDVTNVLLIPGIPGRRDSSEDLGSLPGMCARCVRRIAHYIEDQLNTVLHVAECPQCRMTESLSRLKCGKERSVLYKQVQNYLN